MPNATYLKAEPPTQASVGTEPTHLLEANEKRMGLVITNSSRNYISLAFGENTPVLLSGITLFSQAQFKIDEYNLCKEAVHAIASGAASIVSIQEWAY